MDTGARGHAREVASTSREAPRERNECGGAAAEQQDGLESNGTLYCSLVKDVRMLRPSKGKALPWVSAWKERLIGACNSGANGCGN